MVNQYETVFIMTPVLSEDQMKETVQKFEKILTDKGAEIVHQENWGLRKFSPTKALRSFIKRTGASASWSIPSRRNLPDSIIYLNSKPTATLWPTSSCNTVVTSASSASSR